MADRRYNVLHLRKNFDKDLPIFINSLKGIDNNVFNHIICYLGKNNALNNKLAELGYKTIYLGFGKKALRSFNPFIVLKLIKVIKNEKIDLIHAHKHKPTMYSAITSLFYKRIPIISHVHGLYRTRNLKRRLTNYLVYKFVNKLVAVSDSVKKDILISNFKFEESKVITIRNCIDLKSIDNIKMTKTEARQKIGLPVDVIVFGTVGRLVETKGQIYLIEAFSEVLRIHNNARLVIVGDGVLYGDLVKKVEDLNIKESVLFTGFRKDVLEIIRGFDIFVLPSSAEGLSIALLEAMASRLPVIASNVGGIPEVFGRCKCGILVQPKDIESLKDAMLKMATLSENEKKLIGERGRARIEEEFTIDKMIKQLTNLYDSILLKDNR